MNLAVATHFPNDVNRLTHFEEKIKAGVKLHTLREDKRNRFKPGYTLHMATGVRTENYRCFDASHFIVSTQAALIVYIAHKKQLHITIERTRLTSKQQAFFIQADGFDCKQDFIEWFFPKDRHGKHKRTMWAGTLIHWTALSYPKNMLVKFIKQ